MQVKLEKVSVLNSAQLASTMCARDILLVRCSSGASSLSALKNTTCKSCTKMTMWSVINAILKGFLPQVLFIYDIKLLLF